LFSYEQQVHCEQKFAYKICSRTIKFTHGESEFRQDFHTQKDCSQQRKIALKNQICYQQNVACKICSLKKLLTEFASSREKLLTMKNLLAFGWINTMAKILASCNSEHGGRAQLTGLKLKGLNVLWPDLP
jgi:hypothetical protein